MIGPDVVAASSSLTKPFVAPTKVLARRIRRDRAVGRRGALRSGGQCVAALFVPTRDLGEGDAGEDVAMLQRALGMRIADGQYGSHTSDAVKKWQSSNKVPATGFFGPMSRDVRDALQKNVFVFIARNLFIS